MNSMLHTYVLLAMAAGSAVLKDRFHVDTSHVATFHGLLAIALGLVWHSSIVQHKLEEIKSKLEAMLPKVAAIVVMGLALGMGGCSTVASMSDVDLANFVQVQASTDVQLGLTLASQIDQAKADEIRKDAVAVGQVIDGPVLKLFTDTTAAMTASTLNTATTLLSSKISGIKNGPLIVGTIRSALMLLMTQINPPQLPTATMPARTRGALIAFFTGASQGITAFVSPSK